MLWSRIRTGSRRRDGRKRLPLCGGDVSGLFRTRFCRISDLIHPYFCHFLPEFDLGRRQRHKCLGRWKASRTKLPPKDRILLDQPSTPNRRGIKTAGRYTGLITATSIPPQNSILWREFCSAFYHWRPIQVVSTVTMQSDAQERGCLLAKRERPHGCYLPCGRVIHSWCAQGDSNPRP